MGILDRYSEEIDVAKKYIKFGVIILIILFLFGGVVKKVPAGHVGVLFDNVRGGIQPNEFNNGREGWGLKLPLFQAVEYIDIRTQTLEQTGDQAIIAEDKNGIDFRWDIELRYSIDKTQAAELIKLKGQDYAKEIIQSGLMAKSGEIFGQYDQDKLPEHKLEIARQLKIALQERINEESEKTELLQPNYLIIEAIDLGDLRYNPAIEQRLIEKQQRQQEAEKQQYELQIAKELKEKLIIEAEAQKRKIELEAEAEANAKIKRADAEAYAILKEADAKAAGIDKINKAYQGMPLAYVMTKAYESIKPTDKIILGLDSLGVQKLGIINYNQLMGLLSEQK